LASLATLSKKRSIGSFEIIAASQTKTWNVARITNWALPKF